MHWEWVFMTPYDKSKINKSEEDCILSGFI